jgi:hypothetical protein
MAITSNDTFDYLKTKYSPPEDYMDDSAGSERSWFYFTSKTANNEQFHVDYVFENPNQAEFIMSSMAGTYKEMISIGYGTLSAAAAEHWTEIVTDGGNE